MKLFSNKQALLKWSDLIFASILLLTAALVPVHYALARMGLCDYPAALGNDPRNNTAKQGIECLVGVI